MPSKICAIPFCTSKRSDGISLYEFPSDYSLRQKWLTSILDGMALERLEIGEYSAICANHFERTSIEIHQNGRKCLKKGSVPTIFKQPADLMMMPTTSRGRIFKTTDWVFSTATIYERSGSTKVFEESMDESSMIPLPTPTVETIPKPPFEPQLLHESLFNDECTEILKLKQMIKKLKASEHYLKTVLENKNEILQTMQAKNEKLMEENGRFKKLEDGCKNENPMALFLMDQINNFGKKKPLWSEMTIRNCMLWRAKSPKGYFFAKDFLRLPSRSTLERYVGSSNEEIGLTNLIQTRLISEAKQLTDIEKVCSLVIDDMKIREKLTYAKKEDKFFGLDTTSNDPVGNRPVLANQLMCFVMHGLSTKITIPAGYFFHKQLSTEKFYDLTMNIIKQIHDCGFRVLRIVTDNHKSNVALFKRFGNGYVVSEVEHPIIPNSPLFFSFDYCHIIKNARNLFLNNDMASETGIITANFVRKLYNLQKNLYLKPVPFLTRKHVMPTNIEKMNVKRAVQLFSPKVTSSIEYLGKYNHEHFLENDATIQYMKYMYTFFKIHDVNECSQHIRQNDILSAPFMDIDDERLKWLSEVFPEYIRSIQTCSKKEGVKGLSRETAEAMILTAESTVKTINYLLNNGFFYVLTRRMNSDAVEALFSQLRQGGGFQDATDARAAHYALRRIIKSGIIKSGEGSNLASQISCVGSCIPQQELPPDISAINLTDDILDVLTELKIDFRDLRIYGISSASVAMMSGYLLRTIEERVDCHICLNQISSHKTDSLLFGLIFLQDRGGLKYPSKEFVHVINIISKVVIEIFKMLPRNSNPKKVIMQVILPHLSECELGLCEIHKDYIYNLILEKLLNPLLASIGNTRTDIVFNPFPVGIKPLSRKLIKMS